jgi:ribonuclease Y
MNDEELVILAREISKKIRSELEYPGQIKVNENQRYKSNRICKIEEA